MRRPVGSASSVALLLALVAVAHVQYPAALCAMVLRAIVLSFDNPATQSLDETATQAVPHSDPSRQASEALSRALRPCAPILLAAQATNWYNPSLSIRITRSPPASLLS